ncbi:MAG: 3-hydroxyacyl-CoA dehydrogenase family protein [Burkholderiaceae bacterium]
MSTPKFDSSLYDDPVLAALFHEALALLGDGVPADQIEACGLSLYMPMGPLAAIDRIGLDRFDAVIHGAGHGHAHDGCGCGHEHHGHEHHGHEHHGHEHHGHEHHGHEHHGHEHHGHEHHAHERHAHEHHEHEHHEHAHEHDDHETAAAFPRPAMPEPAVYVVEKMTHGFDRTGRAAGAGFYDYEEDGDKLLWDGLRAFKRRNTGIDANDIRDRLLYSQALVWRNARQAGATTSAGWGFPAGGDPGRFIDGLGADFASRAEALASRFGSRFAPTPGGQA